MGAARSRFFELSAGFSRLEQDHNGFTHQDPGFLDHVINKKAHRARIFTARLNCLLSVFDHCLRSRDYVNVVVAASTRFRNG